LQKKELIHTRNVHINAYEIDDESILLEGSLTDERFFPFFFYSRNEEAEAGMIHQMKISMVVHIPEMTILSIEAEMPMVPIDACREIKHSVKKITGYRIKPGLNKDLKKLFGGVDGCLHLTNLIISMAAAAMQGCWTFYSRKREGGRIKVPDFDQSLLKDSCWLWRESGPLFQRVKKMQEDKKAAGKL
jgi:hypothetical protein